MNEYVLKLDGEQADKLVLTVIKDHKETCDEFIEKLKSLDDLLDHQKIDLADYIRFSEAMKVVLEYFGE
jgi:hypothetical protein